ncbi:Nuclease-related protein domain protein [Congregibacter litoralis KT71]|uniref:Nuclease-related protein domain protein n=1 Tax=Congregibacter litoralis KT71 TaxID=314285 RepID=A4AB39_9GAMM|nr:Nuclease-related protein domain protein [Congregibacter litoralis KT71]
METVQILDLFLQGFSDFWWAPFIGVFFWWLNSARTKGRVGEWAVQSKLGAGLDSSTYTVLQDVTLPTARGTTQIDHIVLSPFGIFVIETKNWSGALYGSLDQAKWTQAFGRGKKVSVQNPFRQNYAHVKAVVRSVGIRGVHRIVYLYDLEDNDGKNPQGILHAGVPG